MTYYLWHYYFRWTDPCDLLLSWIDKWEIPGICICCKESLLVSNVYWRSTNMG